MEQGATIIPGVFEGAAGNGRTGVGDAVDHIGHRHHVFEGVVSLQLAGSVPFEMTGCVSRFARLRTSERVFIQYWNPDAPLLSSSEVEATKRHHCHVLEVFSSPQLFFSAMVKTPGMPYIQELMDILEEGYPFSA